MKSRHNHAGNGASGRKAKAAAAKAERKLEHKLRNFDKGRAVANGRYKPGQKMAGGGRFQIQKTLPKGGW